MDYFKLVKKIIIGVIGITIVLIGIALLILPGPGILIILLGLIILAGQFVVAKHILNKLKKELKETKEFIKKKIK